MSYYFGPERSVPANNQNKNNGIYPKTIFGQSIHENPVPVWTANRDHNPFVLFEDPQSRKRIGIRKDILSCGLLTLAEPGGGKTNLLNMITAMLQRTQGANDKILIFDTKGDYYREFAGKVPNGELVVIGVGDAYQSITSIPNLFAEVMPRGLDGRLIYTEASDSDALQLAKQLFIKMQSEHQPIFPAMAEQVVAGCMVYFMRTYWNTDQSKLNNKAFLQFMTSRSNEELKAVFELSSMKDYRSCISYISGKSNQTQGVSSYIGSVLRELFIGPFAQHNPRKECSMREIVSAPGKKIVFIEYDLRHGETLKPMYGLLLDSALSNALGGRQNNRNNVYFVLDEMLLLPELKHLSNALNFGRAQGVRILCGLQNLPGLADIYGETGAKRILASFQNMIAFRNSDYDTRQFLIERLGRNYQNLSFSAQQKNMDVQREGHTVEDWDVLSLGFGTAIVSLMHERPFLFTMPKYG